MSSSSHNEEAKPKRTMPRGGLRAHRAIVIGAAAGTLAMLCGGCGSGGQKTSTETTSASGSTSSGVMYAKEQVRRGKAVPKFTLDAPPVDVSKARGKLIFNIPSSSANPFNAAIDSQMQAIAKQYGVQFFEYQNQGTPNEYAQGVNEAVARGADVISLMTANPGVVGPALKRAQSAGIPVVSEHILSSPSDLPPAVAPTITAMVTAPFESAARLMADKVIADRSGHADVLIITSNEQLPSQAMIRAIKDEFARRCAQCSTSIVNVPANDWAQKLGVAVQSSLSKDPNIDYVVPLYDSELLFVAPAIRASGKANTVKMVSYNGTPGPLKIVQDSNGSASDIGENVNWLAYANMDQIFRVLAGTSPIKDGNEETPLRLFDATNIADTGTPPTADQGYGNAYKAGYRSLWQAK